jgi:ribonuclease BN (tRNA processing enzyme)
LARDDQAPSLVLDAGSGLRRVATLLDGRAFSGSLLLGHLHLDHVQGLGFFGAADRGQVDVYVPAQGDPAAVLGRIIGPPIFPLTPEELRGTWAFHALEPGLRSIEGWSVLALDIPHGGGRTFGYRISDGSTSLAYLSDHSPLQLGPGPDGLGEYHPAALSLAQGVDLLIHDAQHRGHELPAKAFLGHSAAEYAYGLAERAGARRLALFHHDPERTDDQIDAIVADLSGGSLDVFAAAQDQSVDLCVSPALACQG